MAETYSHLFPFSQLIIMAFENFEIYLWDVDAIMVPFLGIINVIWISFGVKQLFAATPIPLATLTLVTGTAATQTSVTDDAAEPENQPMLVPVTPCTRRNIHEAALI